MPPLAECRGASVALEVAGGCPVSRRSQVLFGSCFLEPLNVLEKGIENEQSRVNVVSGYSARATADVDLGEFCVDEFESIDTGGVSELDNAVDKANSRVASSS